ncbi:hypothetical protein BDK51DRAFT_45946 [Blyttiomyces helicus]|uniref:Uncharacterized protein n=1 Tax=Blyttiomyces helicus TaxID=388810 RepID=A0A4P9VXG6_9FUNG|nr:hypothetical protein BDK51DRAFT_45946 [Blyttiomyces helicus]|eukprot:RKO83595.1 hypothetical protein BDK51DRAFT_45946 [Blyttiomyces helicus]
MAVNWSHMVLLGSKGVRAAAPPRDWHEQSRPGQIRCRPPLQDVRETCDSLWTLIAVPTKDAPEQPREHADDDPPKGALACTIHIGSGTPPHHSHPLDEPSIPHPRHSQRTSRTQRRTRSSPI